MPSQRWRWFFPRNDSTRYFSRSPTSSTLNLPTAWAMPGRSPNLPPVPEGSWGSPRKEVRTLRRAALVHDFGRMGVSNSILDKPGPLGAGEMERVRMAPYLTERILRQSAALAPLGAIAVQHRERLDGSGYPAWPVGGRHSQMLPGCSEQPTPTRRCGSPGPTGRRSVPKRRRTELRAGVKAALFDSDAVEAVLGAAGHRVGPPPGGTGRTNHS